jgi:RimJ/RimL family protein N-acetyltransferase
MIKHGFKVLNLHRIHCGTASNNQGMQKLAEKLGMQKEGIRRDALFKNGKYFDVVEYGIIAE